MIGHTTFTININIWLKNYCYSHSQLFNLGCKFFPTAGLVQSYDNFWSLSSHDIFTFIFDFLEVCKLYVWMGNMKMIIAEPQQKPKHCAFYSFFENLLANMFVSLLLPQAKSKNSWSFKSVMIFWEKIYPGKN